MNLRVCFATLFVRRGLRGQLHTSSTLTVTDIARLITGCCSTLKFEKAGVVMNQFGFEVFVGLMLIALGAHYLDEAWTKRKQRKAARKGECGLRW